jgi:DNA-binding response OmpR family regulator
MPQKKAPQILCVEDDRDLALLVQQRLAQAGFCVDLAFDGEEALAKCAAGAYDLLALDQTLPGRDGLGVLRAIADRGPVPPTVMVTGTGDERLAVQTLKLGADDYVIKDLDGAWLDLLPGVIERVLSHRRLLEEKKAAEAALREKEQQLWRAQKLESLGILAGGVAHDFNNILAGIAGYAELVKVQLAPSDPARNDVDTIKKLVQRAADLTRQMLAYAGKGKFVVEPVNISRIVEDTRKMLEASVSRKTVLKFNLTSELPCIRADASQIHQVIVNLVINASEALGENSGMIVVSTDVITLTEADSRAASGDADLCPGPYVRLEVTDTGCGMDQETMGKIFDPFFTTKSMGRGLGLAAVHGIVRSQHGAVQVSSGPGKGTTFRVLLPVGGPASPAPSAGPAVAAWRGNGMVLVVDNEPIVRDAAQRMLEQIGFSVLAASDGEEAVRLYSRHQEEIACVLLDLTMPKMSGEETFRELRKVRPEVRVVLSSGYSEESAREQFAGLELAGFIQKPYEFETVAAVFRSAVSKSPRVP